MSVISGRLLQEMLGRPGGGLDPVSVKNTGEH